MSDRETAEMHRRVVYIAAAGLFITLAILTWNRSGDLLVDFGRDLYMAWRVAEGAVLYRDVQSLMGPLSPYLNGGLFALFGPSLATIRVANLTLLAIMTVLLVRYFRDHVRTPTLFVIVVVFLSLFGFAYLGVRGNYNFVTPYSHELTHGALLVLAAMVALTTRPDRPSARSRCAVIAGLAMAGAFLTKPEVFAAGMAGVTGLVTLRFRFVESSRTAVAKETAIGSISFAISLLAAFVLFNASMSPPESARAVLSAWGSIFASGAGESTYYGRISGLAHPRVYLLADLAALANVLLWFVAAILVDRLLCKRFRESSKLRLTYRIGLVILCLVSLRSTGWYDLRLAFPILTVGVGIYFISRLRYASGGSDRQRLTALAGFAALAFVMLGKMILATRLAHYGFVLAFPATILLVVVLLDTAPEALERAYGGGPVFREAAYAAIAAFCAFHIALSVRGYGQRSLEIETPRGEIVLWDPAFSTAGVRFSEVLDLLSVHADEEATLVSLPDAAGINYVTGLVNPTPYISIVPPELTAFGEENVLAALRESSPDYVLVSHRSLAVFEMGHFALDAPLAPEILGWLRSAYDPIGSVDTSVRVNLLDQDFTLYRRRVDASGLLKGMSVSHRGP